MSATLRIETIGRCVVMVGERRIEPNAEMVFAILLLLGLERGHAWPRAQLGEILWPNAGYATRASRLRWLLTKLRGLGLTIEGKATDVQLAADDVELDIDAVARLAPSALTELLPGYAPRFSARFVEWLDTRRDGFASNVVLHLIPRLRDEVRAKDWTNAISTASAVLRFDVLNEEGILALAESQHRVGLATQARESLEQYLAALGDGQLDAQLRAKLLLRRMRSADEIRTHSAEPRFVGRTDQLARIEGMLSAARQGRGGALMLVGPAGIGKTRLLEEASIRARIAGMQVVRVRCQRGDVSRPLSGIVDLIPQLLGMRGAAGCQPEKLQHLRRLTDHTHEPAKLGPDQTSVSPKILRSQMASALIDLIDAVSSEAPLVIQIDDAQWLDQSLNTLWDSLATWATGRPVALLFAFRSSRRDVPSLAAPVIVVGSLDAEAASELLDDLLKGVNDDVGEAPRDSLIVRGAGSPLFLRELVRHWRAGDNRDALPNSLLALFETGLAGLSRYALRTLQVAGILGARATVERIEFVVQLTRSTFVDALVELESAGILTSDSTGATYGHVLWAEAAMAILSSNISRLLHRHAAERFDHELAVTPKAALLWESARHWERAGNAERARRAIIQGADHLERNGFPSDAAAAYGRVLQSVTDPLDKLPLIHRRMDLLVNASRWEEVILEADALQKLSAELDPHHDPHNDVELVRLGAMCVQAQNPQAVIERALTCGGDCAATPSHRLQALKECARSASRSSVQALGAAYQLACQITPRSFDDCWNRWRIEWEYELRCGSIDRAIAIVEHEMEVTAQMPPSACHAAALEHVARAYVIAGRFAEARGLFRKATDVYAKRGRLGSVMVLQECLLSLSLEEDPLEEISNNLVAARNSLSAYDPLREQYGSDVYVSAHEAQFALLACEPERARKRIAPLERIRSAQGDRVRARLLAIHLEMRLQLSDMAEVEEIATELRECFGSPDYWLDWPASVYARYLERSGFVKEAMEFSWWFVTQIRREQYAVPQRCAALTRLAEMKLHEVTGANDAPNSSIGAPDSVFNENSSASR